MVEETVEEVEHLETAHCEDCEVEGGDRTENHQVRINRVVVRGAPNFVVSHDYYHAVDVCASDP